MSTNNLNNLLAAAMSAVAKTRIMAYNPPSGNPTGSATTPKPQPYQHLDADSLHNAQLVQGPVRTADFSSSQDSQAPGTLSTTTSGKPSDIPDSNSKAEDKGNAVPIIIYVKTLTGKIIALSCDPLTDTIQAIKDNIHVIENIPPAQQSLKYSGQELQNVKTLAFYKVKNKSTLYLSVNNATQPIIYMPSSLLAPDFDVDFTNFTNGREVIHRRGGYLYKRPVGWMRIALNVERFGADKLWLGPVNSKRKSSTSIEPGEWPVAYHGTGQHNARSIAEEGYLLSKGKRFACGLGVYTTPDIDVAEKYAKQFWFEGEQYKVVLQNRVNPETFQGIRIYSKNRSRPLEYWISPEDGVRPYAFCIKKCENTNDGKGNTARPPKKRTRGQKAIDGCLCV